MVAESQTRFPPVSGSSATEPIACPVCGGRAVLMRRTPTGGQPGEERRTFECNECGSKTDRIEVA